MKLSQQEIDEIRDDTIFKTKTTERLKSIENKLTDLPDLKIKVNNLSIHRNIQWFLLSGIITSILGLAFWLVKANAGG